MINGFYRMTFTGTSGSGFGILVFYSGKIAGADVTGAVYEGTYGENASANEVSCQLTVEVPAGVVLVQTGVPVAAPTIVQVGGTISHTQLMDGGPVLFRTNLGPVNVLFSKISDLP